MHGHTLTARLLLSFFAVSAGGLGCIGAPDQPEEAAEEPGLNGSAAQALTTSTWTTVAPMGTARSEHTATLLPDGKVLVVGGKGSQGEYLTSVERYDPATGVWSAAPAMSVPRADHTATLLQNGEVLIAGGYTDGSLVSALRYNPATNTWLRTAPMIVSRTGHRATLLPDGQVLVTGGFSTNLTTGGGLQSSAERYNPSTNTWTLVPSMTSARNGHTATLLQDGQVLVAGGFIGLFGSVLTGSAERYNPSTNSWTTAGSMAVGRTGQAAVLLPGGVLVVGGTTFVAGGISSLTDTSLYDPNVNSWTNATPMASGRTLLALAPLPGGEVLAVGGTTAGSSVPLASTERFNPATGTWSPDASLSSARSGFALAKLADGRVLVAGGIDANNVPVATVDVYDAAGGAP